MQKELEDLLKIYQDVTSNTNIISLASIFIEATREVEAPETAPFGNFLWPEHREGMKEIKEKPTELESMVYKDIRKHFASSRKGLPEKTVKILKECLKKSWYKKVLHPPPYNKLYRGVYFSTLGTFQEFSNLSKDEIENKKFIEYAKPRSFTVKNGNSTSWTFKKKISKDFSTNYGKAKKGFIVTLIAKTEDNKYNFLAGPGGLYDVNGLSRWHLEKETVGLEPVQVYRIEWEKI